MKSRVEKIDILIISIPRDTPYLGPLEPEIKVNEKGYFIRPSNKSIYHINDQSLLVKITLNDGTVGWGECVSFYAPEVTAAIIRELVGPLVIGKSPIDVVQIYEDMYDAMRVRGFFGGFYHDALAALDIALWDAKGKLLGLSICDILGSKRYSELPAYISGLPARTLNERVKIAKEWISKGFTEIKFASAVSHEGILKEMDTLREALGLGVKILVDLHWKYTAAEAIKIINKLDEYDLYVAEAPVKPEDIEGQALVKRAVRTHVAIGEELRTVFEYRPRLEHRCMDIIQPEVGRTGITSFWKICQMAQAFNVAVMPHSSIGIGIFQAASLQASVALNNLLSHEYQHSIFDKNLKYLKGNMDCKSGFFKLPSGIGLGVEPTDEIYEFVKQ